jgi:hypothetical protein
VLEIAETKYACIAMRRSAIVTWLELFYSEDALAAADDTM